MKTVPLELSAANAFVAEHHRHHDPVKRDKWRFGAIDDTGKLIGVLHAAKPVARMLDDGKTVEIVRLCTDGTRNLCSFMLGRAMRIAKAMGYRKMISYILETENGISYRAAGWHKEADTRGHTWNTPSRPRTTAAPTCNKQRWAVYLQNNESEGSTIIEKDKNHLAAAEMSEEQNYNSIDGMINNSVKPSILEQMKEYQQKLSEASADKPDKSAENERQR